MARKKITVVGAGNVGGTLAQRLVEKQLGDVVLVDIAPDFPQGKALDLNQAAPIFGTDCQVTGSNEFAETAGSDLIILTAGIARKPGMSRDDLINTNTEVIRSVTRETVRTSPDAKIVVVTNPLDAMTFAAWKVSGFPPERVMGMAGVLDAARFRTFLGWELKVSPASIQAMVLGGHGDTMVPILSMTTVGGIPVEKLIPADRLAAIVQRTRDGGAEIVKLLKTGSAFSALSAGAVLMAEAILRDTRAVMPVCAYCRGQYGVQNSFVGVPVVLGSNGIEKIVEIKLSVTEAAALGKSVEAVRELCALVEKKLDS